MTAAEPKLFAEKWSPHTLRHSWITLADQRAKIPDSHARALVNHKPKRGMHGDAHQGYVHVHIDDLRISQQRMTDYLLALIELKPGKATSCYSRDISPNSEFYCLHFRLVFAARRRII